MNLEKARLFVLIAILVGGLASSPVFSSINSVYAQTDDVDTSESDEMEEPTACTMEYAPVCGKDGETYGNMCMLESSDAEFAYDGECETDYEDTDHERDSVRYHDKRCWETDDGELRCEGHAGKCVRTDDGIRCEAMDKRCWETDDGELRCEGHAGKCVRTDDGIRCEAMDKRCWETDDGELRCEGHAGKCVRTDDGTHCKVEHDYKRDIKMMLDKYCNMTDEERNEFLAEHDYFREHHDRLANYCEMSEDERADYRETHHDMMMDFKEKHHDMVGDMKDGYDLDNKLERYCEMTDEEKAEVDAKYDRLTDEMKDRIAEYCSLSEDERDAYLETHRDMIMDFKEKHHDMVGEMKDKHSDIRMDKMMEKHGDISDERMDKLQDKFRMHHSDLTDDQRDVLRDDVRDRYNDHYKMKFKARHDAMSDQARADLLQRHSEMRDYKAELHKRSDAMTDEQRDQLRMDFYSKAKDMRHAWLSPHKQMTAGISIDEIECREGLNLVMMNSNGKAMCMKASTAEKLIERGIVVPA